MGINYNIEYFKSTLVNCINNCNLPIGVAYYIVKDVFNTLQKEYSNAVAEEATLKNDNINLSIESQEDGDLVTQITTENEEE